MDHLSQTSEIVETKCDAPAENSTTDSCSEVRSAERNLTEMSEITEENCDVKVNDQKAMYDVCGNVTPEENEDVTNARTLSVPTIDGDLPSDPNTRDANVETNSTDTQVQYPRYDFEFIHGILNSGSYFSPEQYLDSCKWSPDGSCLLTCCSDRKLRLFDLPSKMYTTQEMSDTEVLDGPFKPSLTVSENGAVYDYEWFPFMSSWAPETACFISASTSAPVHLIDAFTGVIRASYIGYNNVFEVASCFGLTFNCDGGKIFCGYRNMIKIFDVAVPGATSQTFNTKSWLNISSKAYFRREAINLLYPEDILKVEEPHEYAKLSHPLESRRRNYSYPSQYLYEQFMCMSYFMDMISTGLNEQTGYISCISINPSMRSLFAAGSFSRTIGLYTEEGDAVCLLKGQRNGLTSLAFSTDGTKLFSGSRMDPEILCWDLRNPGTVLNVLPRVMDTNQRIRISVSIDGQYLLSGGTDGVVRIWNLNDLSKISGKCEPTFQFKAHNDCVNGVSLNAKYPILATSSGKRHTPDLVSDEESDQVFSYDDFANKTENRVSLWWVGPRKHTNLEP